MDIRLTKLSQVARSGSKWGLCGTLVPVCLSIWIDCLCGQVHDCCSTLSCDLHYPLLSLAFTILSKWHQPWPTPPIGATTTANTTKTTHSCVGIIYQYGWQVSIHILAGKLGSTACSAIGACAAVTPWVFLDRIHQCIHLRVATIVCECMTTCLVIIQMGMVNTVCP